LQARGVKAHHLLVVVEQAEIAKQSEVKGWHRYDRLPFSSQAQAMAEWPVLGTYT